MKRFFGFLLFAAIIAAVFGIFMLVATVPCQGAEPSRLVISKPFYGQLPASYPPEVYDMTDAEFFAWATEQNAKAKAEWDEWYKTAPPRWLSYSVTSHNHHQRGRWADRGVTGYNYSGYEQRYNSAGFMYGSTYGSTRYYEQRFLNPDYVSRPLTIINPYCKPRGKPVPVFPIW